MENVDRKTRTRQAILDYCREYARHNFGRAPSLAEIATHMGFSGGAGSLKSYHIDALRRMGYIDYGDGIVRSIRVIRPVYDPADNEPMTRGRPFMWNGIPYESVAEAAHALGVSKSAIRWRIIHGYTSDDDLTDTPQRRQVRQIYARGRAVRYGGTVYPTMSSLARKLNVDVWHVRKLVKEGLAEFVEAKS